MSRSIIKVACICEGQLLPQLFELDQRRPLEDVIAQVCEQWKLANPKNFAFKSDEDDAYITDKNRNSLKEGQVLKLAHSPIGSAKDVMTKLKGKSKAVTKVTLEKLRTVTKDVTFSKHFVELKGVNELTKAIETNKNDVNEQVQLGYALTAYSHIMSHGAAAGFTLAGVEDRFVEDLLHLTKRDSIEAAVTQAVLQIASAFVRNTKHGFQLLTNSLGLPAMVEHVEKPADGIQESAVMLINAMILKCPAEHKKELYRQLIDREVVQKLRARVIQGGVPTTMAHELYALQTYLLGAKGHRAAYNYNPDDAGCVQNLQVLLDVLLGATDQGRERARAQFTQQLGFTDPSQPHMDFTSYPGVLALDNMAFFAKRYSQGYVKMIQQQMRRPAEHMCPFVKIGKELTALLLRVLHAEAGMVPDGSSIRYMPLFFTTNNSIEELFCIGMELVEKTWGEMEARQCDCEKVMKVVEKQLLSVLDNPESMPGQLHALKAAFFKLTYQDVRKIESAAIDARFEKQIASGAIASNKEKIRDQLAEVVHQQRLSDMCKGAYFRSISKGRVRDTHMFYAILSPNHKLLHYGEPKDDVDTSVHPLIGTLETVVVEEIRQYKFGSEVPALETLKNRKVGDDISSVCFAINVDQEDWVSFVAPDRKLASIWMDGLRLLMPGGGQIRERETYADIKTLLDLQMNVLLVNLHGVALPDRPPEVPPLPASFDFCSVDPSEDSTA